MPRRDPRTWRHRPDRAAAAGAGRSTATTGRHLQRHRAQRRPRRDAIDIMAARIAGARRQRRSARCCSASRLGVAHDLEFDPSLDLGLLLRALDPSRANLAEGPVAAPRRGDRSVVPAATPVRTRRTCISKSSRLGRKGELVVRPAGEPVSPCSAASHALSPRGDQAPRIRFRHVALRVLAVQRARPCCCSRRLRIGPGAAPCQKPAVGIQQLTVGADGGWTIEVRINNFSSIPMRFDARSTSSSASAARDAGALPHQPALDIGPESADVVSVQPSRRRWRGCRSMRWLPGRGIAYSLTARCATPEKAKARDPRGEARQPPEPGAGIAGALR